MKKCQNVYPLVICNELLLHCDVMQHYYTGVECFTIPHGVPSPLSNCHCEFFSSLFYAKQSLVWSLGFQFSTHDLRLVLSHCQVPSLKAWFSLLFSFNHSTIQPFNYFSLERSDYLCVHPRLKNGGGVQKFTLYI